MTILRVREWFTFCRSRYVQFRVLHPKAPILGWLRFQLILLYLSLPLPKPLHLLIAPLFLNWGKL